MSNKSDQSIEAQYPKYGVICFPKIASFLGGVSYVRFSARFAWLTLPGQSEVVRLKRSALPSVDKWTAFNLADAAAEASK